MLRAGVGVQISVDALVLQADEGILERIPLGPAQNRMLYRMGDPRAVLAGRAEGKGEAVLAVIIQELEDLKPALLMPEVNGRGSKVPHIRDRQNPETLVNVILLHNVDTVSQGGHFFNRGGLYEDRISHLFRKLPCPPLGPTNADLSGYGDRGLGQGKPQFVGGNCSINYSSVLVEKRYNHINENENSNYFIYIPRFSFVYYLSFKIDRYVKCRSYGYRYEYFQQGVTSHCNRSPNVFFLPLIPLSIFPYFFRH